MRILILKMKPIVNNYKYSDIKEMKERPISNLIEEKEDENIVRMREALIKKEELRKRRKENETVTLNNSKNNQVCIYMLFQTRYQT